MSESPGHGHGCTPGVADHDRLDEAEAPRDLAHQLGLRRSRPEPAARAFGVAVAGTVDGDHAIGPRQTFDQAAEQVILDHGAVAVQQHHGLARAALHVMNSDPVHLDQATDRRMGVLRRAPAPVVEHGGAPSARAAAPAPIAAGLRPRLALRSGSACRAGALVEPSHVSSRGLATAVRVWNSTGLTFCSAWITMRLDLINQNA